MVNNYYTLRALVREWAPGLVGATVEDAFSQVRDELTLAFAGAEGSEWMVRTAVRRPLLYVFHSAGYSKARRNVATLFEAAFGRRVEAVRIAERDRMLFLDLEGGLAFQLLLFGGRANMLLVDGEGRVVEAFRRDAHAVGVEAPSPRAAPLPETLKAFEERWKDTRDTTVQAVSGAVPILDRTLAREVIHRAGGAPDAPADCTAADRQRLFKAVQDLLRDLRDPSPRVYWDGDGFPDAFALTPLTHRPDEGEAFDAVGDAVRVYVRRRLAARHFRRLYNPLEAALTDAADHYRASAERMLDELANPSRAVRYERWGHLLMAAPDAAEAGAEEVTLPDLFAEGEPVTIPLDPARSTVENAERYYDRARRTRRSREEAEGRLVRTEAQAEEAEALLEALRAVETLQALKDFRKRENERLAPFVRDRDEDVDRVPFRRIPLAHGYEVWVGKNARQNDALTFHHAQKYDLWMHARDLPGSHAVLRLPNRDDEPPRRVVEQAAAVAAYYSKGRGMGLVPVIVARRKHVRSPKGSPPGAVRVDHEQDALLVEPRLPG